MEPKTSKKIVSKREYIGVQARGVGLAMTAGLLCAFGLIALFGSIGLLYIHQEPFALVCLYFSLILCWLARNAFRTLILLKEDINSIVPLTHNNIADLPAPDSLVRASEEPLQAQEAVLLRAASQGQETPPEQLVRAVGR